MFKESGAQTHARVSSFAIGTANNEHATSAGLNANGDGARKRCLSLLLGTSLIVLTSLPAFAASDVWQGVSGTTSNWSDANNWNPAAVPQNGDNITLAQTGSYAPTNFNINVTANSLTLDASTNATTNTNGYIINNAGGFTFGLESGGSITDNATNAVSDQINTGITLNGPATITVSSGATGLTIGTAGGVGAIIGTGGLTVSNSGTNPLLFLANNTYTGGTTISAGTLQLGNGGTTGSITGNVTDNGTLAFDLSNNVTFAGSITSSGAVNQIGSGVLTLSGTNTYTGSTTISAGTLQIGSGGSIADSSSVIDNATFDISVTSGASIVSLSGSGGVTLGAETLTLTNASGIYSGAISGTGGSLTIGGGTETLSGTNTYTGGTNINAGTLSISSDSNLGTGGTVSMAAGTTLKITASGTFAHQVKLTGDPTFSVAPGTTTVWSGLIADGSSAGTLQVSGGGTFNPTNTSNSYSGGTIVNAGSTLRIASDAVLGASTGGLTLGDASTSGILGVTSSFTLGSGRAVTLGAGGGTIDTAATDTFEIAQAITGTGGLTVTDTGTLVLAGTSTYTGGTTIASGATLQLGTGGTTGSITGNVTDNGTLVFNQSDNITYAGSIIGSGAVTQLGTGILTLSGTSLYTGGTTINAGTVSVSADANLGASTGGIAINNGSTLLTSSGFTTARNIVLGAGTEIIDTAANTNSNFVVTGVISGAGALNKTDGGALVLTANNTYTGGTTISDGVLSLGNFSGSTAGMVQGNIVDNAQLFFNRTDNITYSNVISGTGLVSKYFTGTLILTADNTYTGGTIVSDGTLQLGNGGTTGMVVGIAPVTGPPSTAGSGITLGAATSSVVFDRSDNLTYAGNISGSGSLVQAGTDTLTLIGDDIYTGGTTINTGGTIQIGNGGTAGVIYGAVVDNGSLVIDLDNGAGSPPAPTTLLLNGVISGSGSLTQEGTGTTILSAANTYTGVTTISAGTLQLGNGSSAGAIVGNVTDNSAIVFDEGSTVTFAGVVSGTGSLTQADSSGNTLILTATNTYSGGTTISAGTLQIGNGSTTGSITGNVTDNGTLSFDLSNNVTYAGSVTGSGAVNQIGGGTLTLSGTNTYTGGTNITDGTLAVSSQTNLGTGPLSISNGSTMRFLSSSNFTFNAQLGTGGGNFDTDGNSVTVSGVISGGSGNPLVKIDTGTLILTGANTYTGGTTISAGALQIGNGTTGGSIQGNLTDNATLNFDIPGNGAFSGVISGSGVVEQIGSGVLTLSGTNTYTGGTNINAGTLSISSDSNLGTGGTVSMAAGTTLKITASGTFAHQVKLTGDPTFSVAPGTTTVWSGLIADGSSAGTLQVSGGGTFNPTNTSNSYSGGTIVNAGSTLRIASDAVLGASTGGLTLGDASTSGILGVTSSFTLGSGRAVTLGAGGGTIDTAATDTFEIAQAITGTGGLTVTDTGTLVLAGTSTYTGGTTIASGATLQLGDGTNAGIIANNVADNGSLTFDEASNQTFTGVISGTGSLTQNDPTHHTLTLTGANTYTGGTTITAGTLQIGSGGTTGSITGNILNNAALVFDRSDSLTYGGAVSGSGTLTQAGSGTLILTGSSTYSGLTTINVGGTLQLGSGGAAGSIANTNAISDNGTLAVDRSDVFTISSSISGSGSFKQTGSGTTILNNLESYSGGTMISAGTLQLGNGTSAGAIVGNITDNSAIVFDEGSTVTFTGVVSGTGSLTQNDSSGNTLILTAANTYTGGTTITDGTLQLGNGTTAGTIVGNVVDNSALVFKEGGTVTFTAAVSGTGSLTQNDSSGGILILTGNNTYTGGTTISAGTVQIGNGSLTGSLAGAVTDETSLAFDNPGTSTVTGVISGAGKVMQIGSGTTILTGTNTYTGGTTITDGTLQIGNGGTTGSIVGAVTDNTGGTLAFDLSNAQTFGGAISGAGGVDQNGTGTQTLTGTSTYTGATLVNAGTLLVDGSIADSKVTVNAGGTVGGVGSMAGLTVANGGTVSPGDSGIGKLTVGGNLVLAGGSTYLYDVSSSSNDLLNVTGTASLNGTLTINPIGITTPGSTVYQVVDTTGGLSGTFSSIGLAAGAPSNLLPIVSYTGTDATLQLLPSVSSLLPTGAQGNQGQVAAALDFAIMHDNALAFLPVTSLSGAQLSTTLAQISGEEATGVQNVAVQAITNFLETMLDPSVGGRGGLGGGNDDFALGSNQAGESLAYNGSSDSVPYEHQSRRSLTLWSSFNGGRSNSGGNALLGSHNISTSQIGGTVGLDYRPSNGAGALGIALGLDQENWNLASNLGKGQATAYQVGLYYSRRWGGYYFSSGFAYAQYRAMTDRTLNLNSITDVYLANFNPWSEAIRAEFGHVFAVSSSQITPYARFQAQDVGVPNYAETTQAGSDPSFALSYTNKEQFDYNTELGAAWNTFLSGKTGMTTDLHARLGWLHDFAGNFDDTATFSEFNGASFIVTGARAPRDAAHLQLGIEQNINGLTLTLNGEGALGANGNSYGGTAAISYRW